MLGSIMIRKSCSVDKDDLARILQLLDKYYIITDSDTRIEESIKDNEIVAVRTDYTILIVGVIGSTFVKIGIYIDYTLYSEGSDSPRIVRYQNRLTALTVLDINDKPLPNEKEMELLMILEKYYGNELIRPM